MIRLIRWIKTGMYVDDITLTLLNKDVRLDSSFQINILKPTITMWLNELEAKSAEESDRTVFPTMIKDRKANHEENVHENS